jgi:hypothetical protein
MLGQELQLLLTASAATEIGGLAKNLIMFYSFAIF